MRVALKPGETYFIITFEDTNLTRPQIGSYEYLRKESSDSGAASDSSHYLFRIVGSDDELALSETQIWQALDIDALIQQLVRFRDNVPK